jgi:hypothetical protein
MSIRFDEKGKFFTDVISKEAVPVIIQTLTHRIHGQVHIRPDERLKDEINQGDSFLAVTEATVFDRTGNKLYRGDFMAINREHIIWLLPEDQLHPDKTTPDGGDA